MCIRFLHDQIMMKVFHGENCDNHRKYSISMHLRTISYNLHGTYYVIMKYKKNAWWKYWEIKVMNDALNSKKLIHFYLLSVSGRLLFTNISLIGDYTLSLCHKYCLNTLIYDVKVRLFPCWLISSYRDSEFQYHLFSITYDMKLHNGGSRISVNIQNN